MSKGKSSKLLCSMFSLILVSSASYAHCGHCAKQVKDHSVKVTIPTLKSGFKLSFAALALKPSASNLNYAIYNKALPLQTPNWKEKEIYPSYRFGFELGVRYVSHYLTGNDIGLNWTHLNTNTSTSVAANGVDYFVGPDYQIGPDAGVVRSAYGSVNFKYDMVNADASQFIDFGDRVQMRFFGGLSAGGLRQTVTSTYTGNLTVGLYPGPFSSTSKNYSNFTGVGPRFGMEMDVNVEHGFSVLGEAAISALIGSSHAKVDYTSSSGQLLTQYNQSSNSQSIIDENNIQTIPGIDTKLGVGYKHLFKDSKLLTIEAGYQASVYINAINQYRPGTLVTSAPIQTGGIFVATMNHTQSNYSVHGPFVKVGLEF